MSPLAVVRVNLLQGRDKSDALGMVAIYRTVTKDPGRSYRRRRRWITLMVAWPPGLRFVYVGELFERSPVTIRYESPA